MIFVSHRCPQKYPRDGAFSTSNSATLGWLIGFLFFYEGDCRRHVFFKSEFVVLSEVDINDKLFAGVRRRLRFTAIYASDFREQLAGFNHFAEVFVVLYHPRGYGWQGIFK